jgi:hypothetical protein
LEDLFCNHADGIALTDLFIHVPTLSFRLLYGNPAAPSASNHVAGGDAKSAEWVLDS